MLFRSIGVLKGALPRKNALKLSKIIDEDFNISTIVNIESLGYHAITPDDLIRSEKLLSKANVIYLDKAIERKAIEIRQQKKMKLGDSIIAATALVNNLTIVTRNETDFYRPKLTIYNPFD